MKLLISILSLSLIILASGCRSASMGTGISEAPKAYASVQVDQSTSAQLDTAIREVFKEHGFAFVTSTGTKYRFTKMGDKASAVLYGTSWSTEYMTIEPELSVRDQGDGNYFLTCEVTVVEHTSLNLEGGRGNRHQLIRRGSKGYDKMLKQVKSKAEMSE